MIPESRIIIIAGRFVFGVAVSVATSGCARQANYRLPEDPALAELYLLPHADPRHAFEPAMRRGDTRFLGVAGFSMAVPGAEDVYDTYVRKYGVGEIYGPGDQGVSEEQAKLLEHARTYARTYNRLLLAKLRGP